MNTYIHSNLEKKFHIECEKNCCSKFVKIELRKLKT